MSTPLDTVVVGGGLSGLACAHGLLARGRGSWRLLEASPRFGGLVRTSEHAGFRFEEGPEAVPSHARAVRELCQELGVALWETPPAADRRFLALDRKLVEIPRSPEDLATSRVVSFGGKLRLLAEASCAREEALDGSIADFARHRLGKEALERLVDPLVAGIHAGDPEELSLRACFPEVVRLVEEHGSLTAALKARAERKKLEVKPAPLAGSLLRPAGGWETLVRALARILEPHLFASEAVVGLEGTAEGFVVRTERAELHARRVVLALPLARARALLGSVAPGAAEALASMRAEDLGTVVHAYRRTDVTHPLDGFGYLVPKSAGGIVLGTLFCSTLDPSAAPPGHVLLRSLVGGARNPEALQRSDGELVESVRTECAGLLGIRAAPLFTAVARYPAAIPRFDLDHPRRRARLAESLPAGLHVLGNFTRTLGLEGLVSDARELARALVPEA